MPVHSLAIAEPSFGSETVTDFLRDGYWLEAPDITGTGKPDLVGYGLSLGEIYWYQNPGWQKRLVVDKIKEPVGMDFGDITGNGVSDLAVCYQLYGPGGTIHHADPEGGKIDWLENPGNAAETTDQWVRHYVGRATGMHRLRVGHFTRTDVMQIIGFPIVAVEGVHAVLPVVIFTQPDDVRNATEWPMEVITNRDFRMIHGVARKENIVPGSNLDSILMASDEGVNWLYFDEAARAWTWEHIGTGEESQFEQTTFKGSGDLDGGRLGEDPLAYVAAVEPFHGNTVAVYVRDATPETGEQARWTRHVLDIYGDPNDSGEGPGHTVMCGDFDGDGDDEFLVGLRGPNPWQGAIYYKAVDAARGLFLKWRVSGESVARIVAGDFTGRGIQDFATISYSVEHYFVAPKAQITLHHNLTPHEKRRLE
ncbi:VCBS repeat-containing protein [Cryobacterium sp. TMT1-3]|uniref:VCBS repeat-containing protein n=1 Tax=Cryobacterium sp. TMT1-3 TaxID=1259237 RepID=UPI00106DA6E2|nr:VCBS repeat-containing protein [Cryobacterium sp. TMT1-3]TFC29920.1 VCBS repeat-containing protein [Cryobacterium sp. TMT1-3]